MDIEKIKSDFEASECFKRFEHVVQYTFFEFGAYIKRTDVPDDVEKKAGKMILALILSWSAWKEANAQAVPEGFVLVPREMHWHKADDLAYLEWDKHKSLFCSENRDLTALQVEEFRLCWCRNKANKIMGDYKAMIESQEPAND